MSEEKLGLWNRHCHTDPTTTKHVNQRGGYTAINPTQQAKDATAEFGPYGKGWGIKNLDYQVIDTGDAKKTISLICDFWAGEDIEFPIAADMPFKMGDDSFKKLRTQCQSKALAMLGFNADIYQGDWEEQGYRDSMAAKFGDQSNREAEGLKAIAAATDEERLSTLEDYIIDQFAKSLIDATIVENLRDRIATRREEIKPPTRNGELFETTNGANHG